MRAANCFSRPLFYSLINRLFANIGFCAYLIVDSV